MPSADRDRARRADRARHRTSQTPPVTPGDEIQNIVFEIGKHHEFESLRVWFQALYETLLGSSQGPRMGSFIALYGVENTRKLIGEALAAEM